METLKAMASNAAALWIKTSETDNSLADACAMYGYDCGFQAGYKAAAPQWISVKDRLPEEDDFCLVNTEFDRITIAQYGWESWRFNDAYSSSEHPKSYVTHWMPLPQPPKEEG
jgi:hypothetical protein